MSYTKDQYAENVEMLARARALLIEAGYDPAEAPDGGSEAQHEFLRPYVELAVLRLQREFPEVMEGRIRGRVAKARVEIYSDWRYPSIEKVA